MYSSILSTSGALEGSTQRIQNSFVQPHMLLSEVLNLASSIARFECVSVLHRLSLAAVRIRIILSRDDALSKSLGGNGAVIDGRYALWQLGWRQQAHLGLFPRRIHRTAL
jgi:hypothetical protein